MFKAVPKRFAAQRTAPDENEIAAVVPPRPGAIEENVTTRGIDLLALPKGVQLRLGAEAVIEITGLRNPCRQIEAFEPGFCRKSSDVMHRGISSARLALWR